MATVTLNNPYEKGTIVHRNFEASLSHYSGKTDEQLLTAMEENRERANSFKIYNLDDLDHFERECRAIQEVMNSRAA